MIRGALYERVSTEQQALHGYSLQAQREALESYCKAHDIKIVGHYTDEGISGGKPVSKRPAMKRLLEDVQHDKIDLILFIKLDRWFRNVPEYYKTQDILQAHHCGWKTILQDYDTTTANGRMVIGIMLTIAQQERERTSQRIKFVFDSKIKNNESVFSQVPLGYIKVTKDGKTTLQKDPQTMEAVQQFWDVLYKTNNKWTAKKVLQDHGIYKSYVSIRQMARKCHFYTGTYRGIQNYCPAYITQQQLRSIQSYHVKKTQHNRVYLLTGLVRCPCCGNTLKNSYVHKPCTDHVLDYNTIRCNTHISDPMRCAYRGVLDERKLEKQLLDNLSTYLHNHVQSIEIQHRKASTRTANVPALKERLRRITTAYINGAYSDDEYKQLTEDITGKIKEAEATAPAPLPDTSSVMSLVNSDYRSIYDSLTREEKQRFWRELISQIHLDGKLISQVVFRFG